MQNWPNWWHYLTSSLNKVASEFFATDALDPLHLTQNTCFWAFWTILLLHESRCKTGRTGGINAKVRKTKLRRNFSPRTHPIHSIGPKLMFWGVSGRLVTAQKSMQNWPNWCHYRTSSLNKFAPDFFTTNAPNPLHLTQNSCFGAFRTVLVWHESRCKTGRTGAIIAQVR
jgi:hypothetical protein